MAPSLEHPQVESTPKLCRDSIVISGMSGLYPKSHNVKEFSEILYNQVNPVAKEEARFTYNHPEVVQYTGTVPDIQRFDAQFFKVHNRLALSMDSMARKILEQSYQAIYDAGVNPDELSGKKVGVYIGSCFSETEKGAFYKRELRHGFGIVGCNKAMFANRVSYCLNAKGPSMAIDNACCSSTAALEQAYLAVRRGECEAAIVGGSYLCLHPQSSVHYGRLTKLSKDGKTKSFDQNADGCGKSECINVLFIQKAKDALRVYAEVLYTKTEFVCLLDGETGPKYGFSRHLSHSTNFINKFYEEANINPDVVEYVEAFGCAEPEADKIELQTIEKVFCEDKKETLLVGSVISNIGYTEAASGIAAITKVLLGYHKGELAANLHCTQPRQDVCALRDGRIRIVTENQPFRRTYAAVNGMSFTGLNSHVLLHGHYRSKDSNRYNCNIPYLITVSGRHEAAVEHILKELKSHPIDPEQVALLHNLHKTSFSGHLGRGFTILDTDEAQKTKSLYENVEYFDDARRPLWLVYSGMGSQWAGMGVQLMRIPIFAAAIEKCHRVLEPKGINIVNIITSLNENFENIVHSFVGIAAVQIGLTDILREIGLAPDGIIGHSVGELGCAYADGCLTAEEMILAAYSRGLVSIQTPLIRGSMAAVGLGYAQISEMCPPEIDVACHNGPDSSTISGPADVMKQFVAELTAKGIFAKEVPCSNIAYHSRYIANAGSGLLKYLKDVIKSPKPRTTRWLSTSVPEEKWNDPIAQLCSAEYHTNNLLNPVLFEETMKLVPSNAVLVEVAPHGLLQAILKRSLQTFKNIPMTRRKHSDNALFVLTAIGKLYMEGFNPDVEKLYPKVNFPVSTGTPFLSHFIKWAHDERWPIPAHYAANVKRAASCNYVVSFYDSENKYLRGHSMRGKTVFPYAASLMLVWDTLSMIIGVPKRQESVKFSDLQLYAQPVLHNKRQLNLFVSVHRGTGKFEVLNDSAQVMRGFIGINKTKLHLNTSAANDDKLTLSSADVYSMLCDRDYNYSDEFRSIASASADLRSCELVWRDNWVTLIDGMLQLNMLRQTHDAVSLPTRIRNIYLNVDLHKECLSSTSSNKLKAEIFELHDSTRCGGVIMQTIQFEHLPHKNYYNKMNLRTLESKTRAEDKTKEEISLPKQNYDLTKGNFKLECTQVGDYDSLTWVHDPQIGETGVSVTVHYAGINNNDIIKINGTKFLKMDEYATNTYGMDFSGITDSGERVMGIVPSGTTKSRVRIMPRLLWPVPSHWSLEDAATVPFAYALAYYCLSIKCDLIPSKSVYVHGASGAVGQAAISVALAAGCRVFATVSHNSKKALLLRLFPGLKAEHVGCSRDTSCQDLVLNATNGIGCHIVINTARGAVMKNNVIKCCSFGGDVIDLTQNRDNETFTFGMYNLNIGKAYKTIDFLSLFKGNEDDMKTIQSLMCEGISSGCVRPLTRVTYNASDAPRAFRLVSATQHRGRVLLRLKDSVVPVEPRLVCNPDSCHLILCGEETFALQFVDRLVERGVKKLCLHYNKPSNSFIQNKIRLWTSKKIQVSVISGNLHEEKDIITFFSKANNLGSVEGVYFVTAGDNTDHATILNKLDKVSRKFGSNLRYFAVLSVGKSNGWMVGATTIRNRIKSQLPAVYLQLPKLHNHNILRGAALDAAERALCGQPGVFFANITDKPTPRLLQLLSTPAGIHLSEELNYNITLEELGLRCDRIPLVRSFLRTEYNIALEEDQIPSLTIESLLNFEKAVTEFPYENIEGLSTFINYVDSDELLATTEIVCLPTLVNSSSMIDDEFTVNETYLCIIPGMEGHHERFRTLCTRLKLPALGLQPGLDHPHETLRETAERYVQVLLKKAGLKNNFYLMGYESGVIVALEVAALLESRGLTGTVFCIGCSPDELKNIYSQCLSKYGNESQLEDAVIRHMYTLMAGGDNMEALENALKSATMWSEKVDRCVRILLGRISHSAQYARAHIEAGFARRTQLKAYRSLTQKLSSKLVLMRARCDKALQQYSLQQYSLQPVTEYQLSAPLSQSAWDLQCAAIINSHLDPLVLEEFQNKNICDSYFLNADSFLF